MLTYDWIMNYQLGYGVVIKDDAEVAFLQGDEAYELDEQLDNMTTHTGRQYLLSQYDY